MCLARSRSSIYGRRKVVELFLLVLRRSRRSLAKRYAHTEGKMMQKIEEIILNNVIVGIHKLSDPAIKVLIGMNVLKQLRTVIDDRKRSFELEDR